MTRTAVILAGGKGTRLGTIDKGLLTYQGRFFIERILSELSSFVQCFVSTNTPEHYQQFHCPIILDKHRNIGAIEGIYQGLQHSNSDWTFMISVDQPLFSGRIPTYLQEFICSDYDVIIPKDHKGISYPLCGYYHKRCQNIVLSQINSSQYSIYKMLELLRVKTVDISQTNFYSPKMMINVNSPEDKEQLPLIAVVSGNQNSGKTTLICNLITEFTKKNKSVAVIKHTSHSYPFDEKGKDTFLFRQTGAKATAIFSPNSFMINQEIPIPDFIKMFEQYDVILLEGFKDSSYQKIQIMTDNKNDSLLTNVIAHIGGNKNILPHFAPNQIQEIMDFLLFTK
ncbi:MAG: molybdopterin-guanine dinucleotide biosynthesis protein B [Brevinemataceae bacterium]